MDLGNLVEIGQRRVCPVCLRIFHSEPGRDGRSALQKIAEHLLEHQPSPDRWTVAYERIRERMPKRESRKSGEP